MAEAMQAKGRLSREVHFYSVIKEKGTSAATGTESWEPIKRQIFRVNSYANENSFGYLSL
jgi:hypothetical protein